VLVTGSLPLPLKAARNGWGAGTPIRSWAELRAAPFTLLCVDAGRE
jgi:hypothetical protein